MPIGTSTPPFTHLTDEEEAEAIAAAMADEDYPPKSVEFSDDPNDSPAKRTLKSRVTAKRVVRTATTTDEPTPAKKAPPKRKGAFEKPLTDLYTGVGAMLFTVDQHCGQTIIESAPNCAKALDDLAYQNDAVRKALSGLLETSTIGVVIVAHLPIIMAVASHHMPGRKAVVEPTENE